MKTVSLAFIILFVMAVFAVGQTKEVKRVKPGAITPKDFVVAAFEVAACKPLTMKKVKITKTITLPNDKKIVRIRP